MQTEYEILETKRDSRYSLLAILLKECRQPKRIVDVQYFRPKKFTTSQLKKLMENAVKLKLLKQQNGKYKTTLKGETYITKFEDLLKFLGSG